MANDIEELYLNGTRYGFNDERLASKANIDGAYDGMTVGNAEQLVGTTFEEDSVPYNFRTSGGSIDIGDREYDELVGGTVAWNQLCADYATKTEAGITLTNNGYGKLTASGTSTAGGNHQFITTGQTVKAGHKYLINAGTLAAAGDVANIYFMDSTNSVSIKAIRIDYPHEEAYIVTATTTGNMRYYLNFSSADIAITGSITPQVIDLTQMFGSTIADYINSLETANAGAGVAWFKKLFPKDYYPYNAGQLMSVKASAHNTVGFNAWDEEWELGYYNVTTGEPATSSQNLRSKNFIPVVPNTSYYAKIPTGYIAICEYDADKNFIKCTQGIANSGITTTDDTHFIRFHCTSAYGTTYNNDICINLSWDGERDGEYEPYVKHEYALDSDLELRGIPKLDASNNLYYDGDTYEDDGTVTRKWGFYTIQTSDITLDNGGSYTNVVCAKIQNLPSMLKTNAKQAIHSKYGVAQVVWPFDDTSNIGKFANNPATHAYWFIFPVGTTIEQMRTALSGTTIVYELATPTTEEAEPYQNPQIVDDFGTEEYVDAGVTASTPTRDVAIPVGHNTKYQPNLRAKLEMLPNSPDGDGDYLMRQTNGENSFVPFVKELPALPSEDGTYVLKCTVSGSTKTLNWVEEE